MRMVSWCQLSNISLFCNHSGDRRLFCNNYTDLAQPSIAGKITHKYTVKFISKIWPRKISLEFGNQLIPNLGGQMLPDGTPRSPGLVTRDVPAVLLASPQSMNESLILQYLLSL